jgi:hypothetical protein
MRPILFRFSNVAREGGNSQASHRNELYVSCDPHSVLHFGGVIPRRFCR